MKLHNMECRDANCQACQEERATLRARVAEVATILDEYEGNPALAVMLARAALSAPAPAHEGEGAT